MFSLQNFVMKTLRGMNGNYPEFQVREYALNWYSKGVITEDDLMHIDEEYTPEQAIIGDMQAALDAIYSGEVEGNDGT